VRKDILSVKIDSDTVEEYYTDWERAHITIKELFEKKDVIGSLENRRLDKIEPGTPFNTKSI